MKFSVLISVYNKERPDFFKEALNSILHQTLKTNQIVLVCDGPLTEELDKIVTYLITECDKTGIDCKVIRLKKNCGLGLALKTGVEYCSHPWIARMDSDDISVKKRFEWMCDYISFHPEIDLLGGHIEEVDVKTLKKLSERKVCLSTFDIRSDLKNRNPINHVTVMIKKATLLEVGNYEGFSSFEDYYLWIKMFKQDKILSNLDKVLVSVRFDKSAMGRRRGKLYYKNELKIQHILLKNGFSNYSVFVKNYFFRVLPRIMPEKIVRLAYYFNRKLFN